MLLTETYFNSKLFTICYKIQQHSLTQSTVKSCPNIVTLSNPQTDNDKASTLYLYIY